jgi:hypothetical protein
LLAACGYPSLAGVKDDARPYDDAAISDDAPIDGPRTCFGTKLIANFNICLQAAPTMPRNFTTNATINTEDPAMCTAVLSGGTGLCVIAVTSISIEAPVRATGAKPLVLIARDTIDLALGGTLDVASRRGSTPEVGAGGDAMACQLGTTPLAGNQTNGGGAGGSLGGNGGNGGNGGGTVGSPGGGGGTAAAVLATPFDQLRGGCAGQDGMGNTGAKGLKGHGGGAVLLIAGMSITVLGRIHASGEGGSGGSINNSGGGGGGSGGMIALDAPSVTSTGLLLANGGGGGEASGASTPGNNGLDPTTTAAALGGNDKTLPGGSMSGGDGGNGSAGATSGGANALDGAGTNSGGGGGGGGGAGVIQASPGATVGAMVSPPATQ